MTPDFVPLAASVVGFLGRASLEGAIAVAIVAVVVRAVPRLSPTFAAGLWWLACLKFALALVPLSHAPWALSVPQFAPIAGIPGLGSFPEMDTFPGPGVFPPPPTDAAMLDAADAAAASPTGPAPAT